MSTKEKSKEKKAKSKPSGVQASRSKAVSTTSTKRQAQTWPPQELPEDQTKLSQVVALSKRLVLKFACGHFDISEVHEETRKQFARLLPDTLKVLAEVIGNEKTPNRTRLNAATAVLKLFVGDGDGSSITVKGPGPAGEFLVASMLDPEVKKKIELAAMKLSDTIARVADKEPLLTPDSTIEVSSHG